MVQAVLGINLEPYFNYVITYVSRKMKPIEPIPGMQEGI
jgi:hypothetical protein